MRKINSQSCSRQPPQGYQPKGNKGERARLTGEGGAMTAVRTKREVRELVAAAGDAVLPPAEQLARRNIQVVTDPSHLALQDDGTIKKVPARTGLRNVSKIDDLYARQRIDEAQYRAALEVLGWMGEAQLQPGSALAALGGSGGAGGVEGFTNARLDALEALRLLQKDIGKIMMDLLVYVLLEEGDLADWQGLAQSTKAKRADYRTNATMALLLMALDRIAKGA